jgi:hypothetical protein
VAGLVNGFRKNVLLCGGTQMIAAAALIKAMYGNEGAIQDSNRYDPMGGRGSYR